MPSLRDLESPIRTSSQIGGRRRQRGNGSPRAPSSVIQQDNSSSSSESSDDDGMMDLLEEMFNEVMEIANDTYEELDAAQAAAVASA